MTHSPIDVLTTPYRPKKGIKKKKKHDLEFGMNEQLTYCTNTANTVTQEL